MIDCGEREKLLNQTLDDRLNSKGYVYCRLSHRRRLQTVFSVVTCHIFSLNTDSGKSKLCSRFTVTETAKIEVRYPDEKMSNLWLILLASY